MAAPVMGTCGGPTTSTFSAAGTANGSSKLQALGRARQQAQTLLDAYVASRPACPPQCPTVTVDYEPDYDSKAPAYVTDPDTPTVFTCTVEMSRVVTITCTADSPTNITFTPNAVDFGNQASGTTSAPIVITIANGGVENFILEGATVNGPFAMSGLTFPETVAPGSSVTASVTFTPTAAGVTEGSLSFTSNDPSGGSPINLQGTGA